MTRRLRVGVVGLGIGQAHLLAYVLHPDLFEVAVIADTDRDRRERGRTDWGVSAVATLEELLEFDLDLVDICTPPELHEDQCIAALARGVHVICEKPLVGDVAALERLVVAEREAVGHLMPIFQYRFAPGIARMKAVVDAGLCGRLYLAISETSWLRGEEYYSSSWRRSLAGSGGGAVFGHGTHAHDLISYIAGPLTSIQGRTATLVNDVETEDCATGFAVTADGGLVSMAVTLGSLVEITRLRFCFEHVTAQSSLEPYEPGNEPWTFDWSTPALAADADALWREMVPAPSGFGGQVVAFHHAISTGGAPPVTLADARRALDLALGWYESARTGLAVSL